jgi:hypothetical protein
LVLLVEVPAAPAFGEFPVVLESQDKGKVVGTVFHLLHHLIHLVVAVVQVVLVVMALVLCQALAALELPLVLPALQ